MKITVIILTLLVTQASRAQQISEVQPGSTYEKLGIQTGDRIVAYDNRPVDSPAAAMELYAKMGTSKIKSIVVERNGKKQTLRYQVK